jgi:gluconolactonase
MGLMLRLSLTLACVCLAAQAQQLDGQLERFTTGHQFVASLAWLSKDTALLIADSPAGIVRRIDTKGSSTWREGLRASGLASDEKHIYLVDSAERRVVRVDAKGKVEVVAASFEGKRFNGPSDIAVAKNGHVWFVDPAFADADTQRELPFYGVYHVSPKLELSAIARLQSRPNGIALSPDGKTLYVTVADDRTVLAWAVGRNGETAGPSVFAKGIAGVPDGITTSADGRVWVSAREIEVFAPSGGKVASIAVPEKATDCEFGEDGNTLFIAAGTSVYRFTSKQGASNRQP